MTNSDGELISAAKSKYEFGFQVDYFNMLCLRNYHKMLNFAESLRSGVMTCLVISGFKRVLISVKVLKAIDKM